MKTRRAEKAGTWYPGEPRELERVVDACVREAELTCPAPADGGTKPVAVVVPHAGIAYSGPVAAAAYNLVRAEWREVNTLVVFGACHRAAPRRPAIWNEGPWETPLGNIAIDNDMAKAFTDAGLGEANALPHLGDNAIELQTPFIKRLFPEAKMLPVAMSFFPDAWRIGEAAAKLAAESGRTVVAVASTDLTHYGAAFGVTPAGFGPAAVDWAMANDRRFLDRLTDMDVENIVPVAERDGSACGAGAAAAAAGWARYHGCRKGRVLVHTNSHDIQPDGVAKHFVGYAALAYECD